MQHSELPALLVLACITTTGAVHPARAQAPFDPWTGITIPDPVPDPSGGADSASPYEQAVENANAAAMADAAGDPPDLTVTVSPPPPDEQGSASAEGGHEAAPEPAAPGTVWATLGGGSVPKVNYIGATPIQRLLQSRAKKKASASRDTIPTEFDYRHGAASVSLNTSMSATAPVSGFSSATASSGNGEVKGRIDYALDNLVIYGSGNVGASASTGVSLYDGTAVGTTYKMPLAISPGDTFGMTAELANQSNVTTSMEVRGPLGPFERFLSVEHVRTIGTTGTETVKAGLLGKF
ncbi:hypothetical protein MWN34_07065 [Ancylobacter sp. 6x-1]|uniref:Porin family protein n=1 Tax=Ancylobacter crimeensis TaxID=2579147 RepID=A0ABT0D9P9_9HYPH|nr:hypothetical protein [Ancylobacter crimeensis]MCK0196673.1 hypothetical protein [Ancylobacter crimeensis]